MQPPEPERAGSIRPVRPPTSQFEVWHLNASTSNILMNTYKGFSCKFTSRGASRLWYVLKQYKSQGGGLSATRAHLSFGEQLVAIPVAVTGFQGPFLFPALPVDPSHKGAEYGKFFGYCELGMPQYYLWHPNTAAPARLSEALLPRAHPSVNTDGHLLHLGRLDVLIVQCTL